MPEIKTRDVVGGTIKSVDRTALAGQRMKDAYIQTKRKAEHSVYSSESSSEEYASDRMDEGMETVSREAVHLTEVQGQKILHGAQEKYKQNRQSQQATSTTDTPPNTPNAQQPHRGDPDGAVTPAQSGNSNSAPNKQDVIHNRQIASAKTDLKAKRAEQVNSVLFKESLPKAYPTPSSSGKTIKTVEQSGETIKQTASSAGKVAVKVPEHTIKTAGSTVKTVEQVGTATVKTAQAAEQAARKAAIETARTAQRVRAAAKAAASTAKALAAATGKAVRAIIAAAQELGAALTAGGGAVLVLVVIVIVMCFAGMMLASDEDDTEILPVSEEVLAYEPFIQKYAREHGIGDYVLLIEAVMMQESGGRGTDPMQCSECGFNTLYPHTPGGITDPEYSINVGIQNLADCLQLAQCESPVDMDAIKLALQGYNYGQGYITWALNKYGEYTKANAIEFSMKTAEAYGWSSYGDMDYVPHVLRYYPLGQIFYDPDASSLIVEVARSQIGNVGGEPYWSWYGFTERVDWCACFVSWCADKCGYIEAGIFPKFAGCINGMDWFQQRGQWLNGSAEPIPGMIIFFDWEDEEDGGGLDGLPDHVGIVEKVENGRVYTIEGNTSDSCRERSYPLGHYEILGYGIPLY